MEQRETDFLEKPAYLMQITFMENQSKYTVKNYLLKHKERIFGIGYKLKEDNSSQQVLSEIEKMTSSIRFL